MPKKETLNWQLNGNQIPSHVQQAMVANARKAGKQAGWSGSTVYINDVTEEEVAQAAAYLQNQTGKTVRNRRR